MLVQGKVIVPENEHLLLVKVAAGDEKAFEQLYKTWQPKLVSFIFKITKSKDLTMEVVQDVFLKIWMSRETLLEVKNFKAYLFVVSRNQAINAFQKAMKELCLINQMDIETLNHPEHAEDELEKLRFSLIDKAIDQLSARQKQVYLLHRHDKLSYNEIAQKLGIGKESVKTHIELAVKSIKKYITENMISLSILIEFLNKNL